MFDIKRKTKSTPPSAEKKNKKKHIFTSLIPAEEKEYFIENLSMLLSSGMDIIRAMESIKKEVRSAQMKAVIDNLQEEVAAGSPIWKVLEETNFFPAFIISLIKIGEKSGGLVKNLKVIAVQQKKDRSLTSKIRSAMMYPVFVLTLTLIVGVSIAWFILPRLTTVFDQLKVDLPLITRILIAFGKFIGQHGTVAVPAFALGLIFLVYFVFIFRRTKFIGQTLLFYFPGVKRLIQETELARMGYIMGTLLEAGLPIIDTLRSLAEASTFYKYKKLYTFLGKSIEDGNTFQQSFDAYKKINKLVPATIRQMIMAGEQSGHLPQTFFSIGEAYEEKVDNTTKDLAVILEPILLVIVWLGVVGVALAVILPIYSLIGGINKPTTPPPPAPVVETVTTEIIEQAPDEESPAQEDDTVAEKKLEILKTETGFLNVRNAGNARGKMVGKVLPGEQYIYTNEKDNWYEIILTDGTTGWVMGKYTKLVESLPTNASN
jgi:type IV pilus assembly protein PilC